MTKKIKKDKIVRNIFLSFHSFILYFIVVVTFNNFKNFSPKVWSGDKNVGYYYNNWRCKMNLTSSYYFLSYLKPLYFVIDIIFQGLVTPDHSFWNLTKNVLVLILNQIESCTTLDRFPCYAKLLISFSKKNVLLPMWKI